MRAAKDLQLAAQPHHPVLRPDRLQIERELEVVGRLMDNQFEVPLIGWRFGLNAIIDLIPEFGDIATTIVALYILVAAVRYRVPKITLLRMGLNIAIYFVAGILPFAGYAFDVWWKPNIRNLNLLRQRATVSAADAKRGRTSDWWFVIGIIGGVALILLASTALTIYFWWYILTRLQFGF
jgi:hypothetical protein